MKINSKIAEFFATFCYVGKIKYMPGTLGSLVAFPICYAIMQLTQDAMMYSTAYDMNIFPSAWFMDISKQVTTLFTVSLLITFALFLVGTYASSVYIKDKVEQDPKEIVIDEVVGQMLVIFLTSFSIIFIFNSKIYDQLDDKVINFILLFFMPFTLFRIFDILKPWPICWFDNNIKGGLGVMLDDVLAALFATLTHYVIVFCALEFYS